MSWPDGSAGRSRVVACARDFVTDRAGIGTVGAEGAYVAELDAERRITAIAGSAIGLPALIGERAGGRLRDAVERHLPDEHHAGTPLHLILDDLAGASLVAPWAWSLWDPDWAARMARLKIDPGLAAQMAAKENICSGLRTGSSGLSFSASGTPAPDLRDPADETGWHVFPTAAGPSFRRARLIDVRGDTDGAAIEIDAHFQDSAAHPDGGRRAVHEYRIRAQADPATIALLSIVAEPLVLPFAECVPAATNVARLVGTPLVDLRRTVLTVLRGTACCTHLNDALRALAEVPVLLGKATSS